MSNSTSSRLLISLVLVVAIAWSGCFAQDPGEEVASVFYWHDLVPQIVPSATMDASGEDNSASAVAATSAADDTSETASSAAAMSASQGVLQPSQSVAEPASAESSVALAPSSMDESQQLLAASADVSSSVVVAAMSSTEFLMASSTVFALNSEEEMASYEAMASMLIASMDSSSSVFALSPSLDIQPTESVVVPDISPSESGSVPTESLSVESVGFTASVEESLVPSAGSSGGLDIPSLSASGASVPSASPGADVISPSSSAFMPPASSAVVPVPASHEEGNSPEEQGDKGGDSGMSPGAKAAVGIFVTLACIGLVAVAVVLYRKNYFSPRSLKSLVKGGVRYQTHDDSMSYNDEGMLILPERRSATRP